VESLERGESPTVTALDRQERIAERIFDATGWDDQLAAM
jgi:hypothetical protein